MIGSEKYIKLKFREEDKEKLEKTTEMVYEIKKHMSAYGVNKEETEVMEKAYEILKRIKENDIFKC